MILSYIQSFKIFSDKEIEDFAQLIETRKLLKNEYFVQENDSCKEIAFVQNGIFRTFYTTADGKDITYCFRFPNEFVASYSSFISGKPSKETIQAIADADIFVLNKDKVEALFHENPRWILFLKIIAEQEYMELEERYFQLQRNNASQRYEKLLKNQPNFIQQIPLQYLATYLGITQRHLSRLRKDISF